MDQQSSGPKRSRDDDEDQHDDATGKSSLGGTDRKKKSERERSRRLDFNSQLRSLRLLLIRVSPELDNSKDRNRLFGNRVEVLNETRNALERLHEENEERSKIIAEMMSSSNSVASLSSGEEEHHSTLVSCCHDGCGRCICIISIAMISLLHPTYCFIFWNAVKSI